MAIRKSDVLNAYEVCRHIKLDNGPSADVYALEIIIPVAIPLLFNKQIIKPDLTLDVPTIHIFLYTISSNKCLMQCLSKDSEYIRFFIGKSLKKRVTDKE